VLQFGGRFSFWPSLFEQPLPAAAISLLRDKRISFAFLVERQWTSAFSWTEDVEGDLP
jgi:hypothetical protein